MTVAAARDDLGTDVTLTHPVCRVVSLVPSLTEALAATRRETVVGATDWCTYPADLEVTRVRGTKNPDVKAVVALGPDLVVANREENRELDVRRLRDAGVPVWVTVIETLDDAFASMRRLFVEALGWGVPDWLEEAEGVWAAPPPEPRLRVAVPIWRDPWMVVGPRTFTTDLMSRLGWDNVFAQETTQETASESALPTDRYPHVDVADLARSDLDLVVLPDEPYAFTDDDGPEAFPHVPVAFVSGRALTWYGPSLVSARAELSHAVRHLQAGNVSAPATSPPGKRRACG